MIHEACSHGLEADLVKRPFRLCGENWGEGCFHLVTVIDDATLPNKYGSFDFDDEGTESQKV